MKIVVTAASGWPGRTLLRLLSGDYCGDYSGTAAAVCRVAVNCST